mmetsp:Transcript_41228/g.103076  ORF Transcript_41228/g.103076 Transcript_41228/m.103076 type:complete len:107 (+) Transcript_41228:86-406(+)
MTWSLDHMAFEPGPCDANGVCPTNISGDTPSEPSPPPVSATGVKAGAYEDLPPEGSDSGAVSMVGDGWWREGGWGGCKAGGWRVAEVRGGRAGEGLLEALRGTEGA